MAGFGVKGNKGGGRHKVKIEAHFWKLLDEKLPKAVNYCARLIEEAEKNKNKPLLERQSYDDNALRAAKILMSKAPQRLAGPDGGELFPFENVTEGQIAKVMAVYESNKKSNG
ncbi:MAG: hypothetical protein AAB877_00070 [Patescibacteria group bacterium]